MITNLIKFHMFILIFFISLFFYFFFTSNVLAYNFTLNNSQKVCVTSGSNTPPSQGTLYWVNYSNPPANPAYTYISLDSWDSLSIDQKFYIKPSWTFIFSGNCSSLNVTYVFSDNSPSTTIFQSIPSTTVIPFIPSTTIFQSIPPFTTIPNLTPTTEILLPPVSSVEPSIPTTDTIVDNEKQKSVPVANTLPNYNKVTTTIFESTTTLAYHSDTTLTDQKDQSKILPLDDQPSQYDPKYVALYALIAFLVFLLLNNFIKYTQIYKYGHETWPQRIWRVFFK